MGTTELGGAVAFDEAARTVLTYLRTHIPMGFWSVTRVENGRQTYLFLDENSYGLREGESHPWADSFCIHMASGLAPAVAADASVVPVYAAARIQDTVPIGAYAGAPILEADGTLFGAICGIDPEASDDPHLIEAEPLLTLLSRLLSAVLHADRGREAAHARAVEAELAAETDALTGLYNRRAWDRLLEEELLRFARFGDPTVIVMADLDYLKAVNDARGHAAGDAALRGVATSLRGAVRHDDVVARLGGDEFGLLLRSCEENAVAGRVERLRLATLRAGVPTSMGCAPLTIQRGLATALAEADAALYEAKRRRRPAAAAVHVDF